MDDAGLTDRAYWVDYWSRYVPPAPSSPFFADLRDRFPPAPRSFLEIGGFPGTFSAWFHRELGYDVTLLDHVVVPDTIRAIERRHGLRAGTIGAIEADLRTATPERAFDVVFSAGVAEHFEDTAAILARHVAWLAPGGMLFVSVPNLLGLAGATQRLLDPENLARHNLDAMQPERLRAIALALGLVDVSVTYEGVPELWVDRRWRYPWVVRKSLGAASRLLALLGRPGRLASPHVVLTARRPAG